MSHTSRVERSPHFTGVLAGIFAFLWWGCFPLYWDLLKKVPALEILAHRIFWSLFFAIIVLAVDRQLEAFGKILTNRRLLFRSFISALIISANWGMYILNAIESFVFTPSVTSFSILRSRRRADNTYTAHEEWGQRVSAGGQGKLGIERPLGASIFKRSVYVFLARLRLAYPAQCCL